MLSRWKVTDFKGNCVEFDAEDLDDALDICYESYREVLFGNAPNWELSNDAGESHPRQEDYDWERNEYGYERDDATCPGCEVTLPKDQMYVTETRGHGDLDFHCEDCAESLISQKEV